ncbi:OprD family porin [Sulfurimonas sediminis]|uniref:OprD family porin n=1 Tax=Sulfurimonas sediminis TaxID=2590020 RepID=A0A7M1B2P3_9BACT|nr:OprD family outer membrane porin [Sulfurimonas sediminis]QOP42942.1 OprD family porin [Sulfurimonas sediminis]
MLKIIRFSILYFSFTALLSAAEHTSVNEKRLHSVRKNIDKEALMQVKKVSATNNIEHMFEDARISGQLRTMFAGYEQKEQNVENNYATAVGGKLKYELAELQGFNAGAAVYISHDLGFATGEGIRHNSELSSGDGSYTQLAEAYINYKYKAFNIRAGRQILDTPLADSDDIRMISNTFEAYVASYSDGGLEMMAGNIQSWQGVDAGLDTPWEKTGSRGTNFGGLSYHDVWELNLWYYNITDVTNAFYFDGGIQYHFNEDMILHCVLQYLNETELASSAYDTTIYGGLFEFVVKGISLSIAYDKSLNKAATASFSGFGGGTLFSSMDTLILDDIADDRDAHAFVSSIGYTTDVFTLLYAYGDFKGNANSLGVKAHIIEQDVSLEYNIDNELLFACVYSMQKDKENFVNTDHDWNRIQFMVNYNF